MHARNGGRAGGAVVVMRGIHAAEGKPLGMGSMVVFSNGSRPAPHKGTSRGAALLN
jgi:hypothetical protein